MQTQKVQGLIVEVQKGSRAVSICNSLLPAGSLSYILPFLSSLLAVLLKENIRILLVLYIQIRI